jgi:hypothetical protein
MVHNFKLIWVIFVHLKKFMVRTLHMTQTISQQTRKFWRKITFINHTSPRTPWLPPKEYARVQGCDHKCIYSGEYSPLFDDTLGDRWGAGDDVTQFKCKPGECN